MTQNKTEDNFCSLCGAWKGAFGLEPTPELYIQHTIEILREIRRVLRKDGVVFWNIGDSYYGGAGGYYPNMGEPGGAHNRMQRTDPKHSILKSKDLCLIPFHIAIAAQEDGWWIRSVIIWNKPNPMPESVTDRPTNSYEFILMLTKSKKYYWDADAVREPYTEPLNRWGGDTLKRDTSKTAGYKDMLKIGYSSAFRVGRPMRPNETGRNLRDVWTFPTMPYPEAHFAVFPEKLPELCIKAATSEKGCCPKCGAPWTRVTETSREFRSGSGRAGNKPMGKWAGQEEAKGDLEDDIRAGPCVSTKTLGWRPTCHCERSEAMPCIVLYPFTGTGTTLWIAKKLGRWAIGYDISETYCQLAVERNRQAVLPGASA